VGIGQQRYFQEVGIVSETKHTPGPWAVYTDTLPFEINGQPRFHTTRRIGTVAHHPQLHGPEPVVYLSSGLGPHTFVGIKEADARLIAAAPDLLAACKLAAETFRRYGDLHAAKGPQEASFKALDNFELADVMAAAIARADGR